LDILRGFTGAEKLAFSPDVRQYILEAEDFSLETIVGCPAELFHAIGIVLDAGRRYLAKELDQGAFEDILGAVETQLRQCDLNQDIYPTSDPEWRLLAEAYRHACILRVLRFPDAFATPCTDPRIQESVHCIFEACAQIPWSSPLYRRLLFPIFMAAADTTSLHQQHYARLCIEEIQRTTRFTQPAVMDILNMVWQERAAQIQSPNGLANVPWMEYVRSHQQPLFSVHLLTGFLFTDLFDVVAATT